MSGRARLPDERRDGVAFTGAGREDDLQGFIGRESLLDQGGVEMVLIGGDAVRRLRPGEEIERASGGIGRTDVVHAFLVLGQRQLARAGDDFYRLHGGTVFQPHIHVALDRVVNHQTDLGLTGEQSEHLSQIIPLKFARPSVVGG